MKRTIEILLRLFAPPARTVALLLAVCAASGARATDSLEETGGFVTETSTLAFKGMTLDEITATTLHGRIGGGWMSGKVGNPWGFYVFDRSVTGQMKCEAQINDSGTIKGVRLVFTQSGDDVYVATDGTGAAAMRYKSGATLGESLFVDGTTTPSGNGSDTAYRVYNLSLTRTWSDSAVVLWEAGQFGVTSKTGSDGNTYTLSLNGNASDGSTITIDQSVGVKVDFPSAKTSGVTVLFRYSDLTPSGEKALVFSTNSQDANRTGVYLNSTTAGQPTGIWNTTGDYTTTQNRNNMTSALSAGVFAFQYREGTGATSSNANGTSLYVLTNGVRYAIYTATGLKTDSNSYGVSGCTLGGMRTKTGATLKNAATGMKITGIAVFDGILSETQMTSFVWPSAAAAEYAKWSYASYVLTCNSGFSNFESPNYSTFDLKSGYDIMPTYTTSVAPVKWQCFGYSKASGFDSNAYAAPGNVLRFVNASHACVAKFSPLTIGGMIVESTATGCSLEASDGTRSTILGDPTANAETWFKFDTSFSMARTGAYAIMGTVNLEINNSASVTFAGVAQISGAGAKAAGTNPSHTAGGVLKIHGNGSMTIDSIDASDATLDYTDLSATSSTAAGAYIQGTLTVNESTVIALPAGATFPYFVASAASGTLDPVNGVTIGGVSAPGYKLKSDGSVVAPRTVTISGNETWGTGTLNGWPTDDSTEGYAITVTADATLTLPSAVSCDVLSITVEDGVTLTISGNTITAADCFYLTGNGVVKVTANNAVSATVKGDGTLLYQYSSQEADAVPSGAVFTDSEWTGTLWIKDFGNESYHSGAQGTRVKGALGTMVAFGNTYSKVKFTNVKAYYNNSGASSSCSWTLVLEDGEGENAYAWKNDSGWSNNNSMTIAALAGTGTYYDEYSTCTPVIYFTEASEFRGTIYNKGKKIGIGNTFQNAAGTICIGANKSVTVASGKTWTVNGGIVNNGTMALNGALSGTVTGSGTIECGQGVDLTGSGFGGSANWTGTVRLNGDATPVPSTSYDETSYGNASSTLEIASGSVAITEATTLPGTVNVASGASLFVTSSATELTLAGSNSGTINLSVASALKTLNLNLTGNGSIVYPSSLTTLNVTYTESLADDGVKAFTVNGATFAGGTMMLTRPDGTTESVTGTADGNTLSFEWTPAVSGAACWCAYEMEYESGVKTGFENSGSDNSGLNSDSDIEGSDAFTDDGMLYTYAHPWRDITYPTDGNWTAVVRCTVPAYENAAVITFGTCTGGLIGLVAGADPETQMKLVKTTGNSAFTTLATMTVQNATTAQHVYVFSVENNQTIKVYCDGEQVLNETYSTFTLGGGIQVGSVHGGIDSTGIVRFAKNESPANTLSETVQKAARIDCVRLYKTVLGPNAIAALTEEFPAVKLYRATVAADATTTWDALTWSPAWDGGNAYSKTILTAAGGGTLTLPESIKADEFIVNVAADSTLTLAKASGGSAMTVSKLEINDGKVAVADANFFGSRVINGTGTLKITAIGALTSALSGNAKFEIPSGVAVGVLGGSIANAITGVGELVYQNPADVPASSLSFGAWTGTVSLPSVNASSGVNFNNYGVSGSTVALAGVTGGYILEAGKTVAPTLRLNGNMNLTSMSTWTYTFSEITGTGNLSFSTSANNPTVVITKTTDYTGTITSSLSSAVTVDTIAKTSDVASGDKVLSISGNVTAQALTVNGDESAFYLEKRPDGIYAIDTALTIGEASFDYNATYASAQTVTAPVTGYVVSGTTTFTLTVGQNAYTGVYNSETGYVTFSDVTVGGLGTTTSYTITAEGDSTGTTGAQSATVGNAVDGSTWMKADVDTTNVGTWKDENDATVNLEYTNGVAALAGTNIYTAAWTSTGEVVTVTTKVAFGSPADSALTVDADAQAAIRIGTEQGANVFQIYAGPTPSWESVYNDTLGAPAGDATYALTLTLNYASQTFGVSVGGAGALTNAAGTASFQLAKNASTMQKVSYRGVGTFKSLVGSYVSAGYSADVGTEGNATNVVVAQSFVSDYLSSVSASEISTYLNPNATSGEAIAKNGLNYFKCYALGLDPTKTDDKPIVDVTTDENGNYVFTVKHRNAAGELVEITPADNVSTTVTLKYGTGAASLSGSATGAAISPAAMFSQDGLNGSNVIYYKAEVTIGAK